MRIAIVGAGSAGLLLAALLPRPGHRVSLLERAPQVRCDGCGILLVKSGVEALAAAELPGLLERVLAAGVPVSRFVVRNLRGDLIESSPAAREPGELPSLLVPRRAIQEALAAQLAPGVLRGGAELLSWRQEAPPAASCDPAGEGPVQLVLADGGRWQGDLLVGADGLWIPVVTSTTWAIGSGGGWCVTARSAATANSSSMPAAGGSTPMCLTWARMPRANP